MKTDVSARYLPPEQAITKEKLDQFLRTIPIGACAVIYDIATRKALFYKKTEYGYRLFHKRNKRATPISIRKDDYVLTMDFNRTIVAGDTKRIFVRESAQNNYPS